MQKRSRTVRPILFAFLGSRRQWLCQAMRARLLPFLSPRSGDSTPVQVVRGTSSVTKLAARRSSFIKKVHPFRLHLPPLIFRKNELSMHIMKGRDDSDHRSFALPVPKPSCISTWMHTPGNLLILGRNLGSSPLSIQHRCLLG